MVNQVSQGRRQNKANSPHCQERMEAEPSLGVIVQNEANSGPPAGRETGVPRDVFVQNEANWPAEVRKWAWRDSVCAKRSQFRPPADQEIGVPAGRVRQTKPISRRDPAGINALWKKSYGKYRPAEGWAKQSQFLGRIGRRRGKFLLPEPPWGGHTLATCAPWIGPRSWTSLKSRN